MWTVDEEADMERLLAWGADGLISNRPDLAVAVRKVLVVRTIRAGGAAYNRSMDAPTYEDVVAARARVYAHMRPSPLLKHPLLDEWVGR